MIFVTHKSMMTIPEPTVNTQVRHHTHLVAIDLFKWSRLHCLHVCWRDICDIYKFDDGTHLRGLNTTQVRHCRERKRECMCVGLHVNVLRPPLCKENRLGPLLLLLLLFGNQNRLVILIILVNCCARSICRRSTPRRHPEREPCLGIMATSAAF